MIVFQKNSPTTKEKNVTSDDEVALPSAQGSKQEINKLKADTIIQDPKLLFASLLKEKPGIALGVDHRTEEIYSYLADHAPLFKESGVKSAFMEIVLSKDTAKVQDFLEKGNDKGLKDYLSNRTYAPDISKYYFNLLKSLHKNDIEIIGIDILTSEQRLKEANPHWIRIIKEKRPEEETSKYIVIGGSSHFGHTLGSGVNIELNIPNIKFYVGKGPNNESIEQPRSALSVELFENRPMADYAVMLPSKESKEKKKEN
jgi:hypothetical protein